MQEKLKSLQNIMSQRGYNKSASTARENTDLKSNLKSLQDILVKRGYTPKSVPSEQKSKTRHKEKDNNLFEETSKSTFETMPKYQEAKQKHQKEKEDKLNAMYDKYGIDPNNFSYDDFSKWAEEHNFNRIPHNDPLEAGYDWLPNEKGVSKEVKKDKETLEQLALNNQRKNTAKEGGNAPDTFITSLMDGATLGGRSAIDNLKSQKKYKEAGLNVNDYVSEKQANAKSSEEHPIASTVGDLAGSTVSLIGLGEAVGGALKGVKWLAKTPTWVQGAIKNGIVFGLQQGTEATTDGKKAKDIAKETAIGVVGGAVGGATSSTVEDFAENILFKTKLQHKFIPEMIRNGVAGASFAGADSAATYFLHPKEERPTAKDVAKNIAVTFAFATITSAINMGKIKQSSKEALDVVNDKMMKDYEGMMNSASTNDVESVKQFAKNVMDYSDSMIKYLDGEGFKLKNNAPSDTVTEYLTGKGNAPVKDTVLEKARFVGEDARVRSMQEDLRTIKSRAKEFYDRADSIPYDVEKISKTSNVGNVDNITKEPTNINNTNPTPQNTNSIQNVPKTSEVEPIQTVQEQTPISVKTNDVEVQKTDKLPKEVQDSVSKADVVAENNPQGYNKDFVRRYANSFVEVAQKSDNYPNRDFLDNNIADELTQKILTGESKLDGNSAFDYAVKQFKFILNQADESKLNQVQQFNENQKQQNDVSASEINTDNSIINDTADSVNSADTPTTTDTAFNDTQENGVQSSVNRVTEEVHNAMNKVGLNVSESATGIQEANTKFMSNNDNLFDRNYVSNYANDFVQAMSEKNGRSYTVLSQETDNLADELVNKTLTGNSVLDGNREFQPVVRNFKDVLREGIKKNANLHNNVYGANEVLNAQVQDIENGDYSSLNITENPNNNVTFAPITENEQNIGYIIERDNGYSNELSESDFTVKQKNGEYGTRNGITYGHFGTHQNSNGNNIVSYLPTGNAVAILPNQNSAIEFMKQAENETSGYSIYLYDDNGVTKTGGDMSQFINVLNNAKNTVQVEQNSGNIGIRSDTDVSNNIESEKINSQAPNTDENTNTTQTDNAIKSIEISEEDKIPGLLQDEYSDLLSLEDRTALDTLGSAIGVPIKIVPTISNDANGCYYKGVIYISLSADDKVMTVFSHELTHYLEDTLDYTEYKKCVLDFIQKNTDKSIDELAKEKVDTYAKSSINLTYEEATREIVADYTQNILKDADAVMEFVDSIENKEQKRGVIRRLLDAIKELINKIKAKFSSKHSQMQDLQKTHDLLENMLKEAAENTESDTESETRYSFGGEKAKTADIGLLQKAETLEKDGASAEEIRKETGWSRGLDNKWKFEIDDSQAKYNEDKIRLGKAVNLNEVLEHKDLFKAYPDLKKVKVKEISNLDANGIYSPNFDCIFINENLPTQKKLKSLIHEVQHAIQVREGFAVGESPDNENRNQSAGEIEADDVKARQSMSKAERLNTFPKSMKPNPIADVVFWDNDNIKNMGDVNNQTNGNSNIYDYTKSFAEQINDWKQGLIPQNDSLLVSGTPEVLKKTGFNALPITINQKHIDYAINGTKDVDHHLGETLLKQLPQALENPVAIISSQTQPNRVVAILKMQHNGKNVITPVEIDGYGTQNNLTIDSNAVVSIFGKDNAITKQLKNALIDEANNKTSMFYWNKKEALSLLQRPGLRLPNPLPQDGFIHNITEKNSSVKPKIKNATYSQQFKRWFGDWENNPKKASKVVNDDGTPLIVYHGTNNETFNTFDNTKSDKEVKLNALGDGYYFTKDKSRAERYGKRVIEAYLDIKKPYRAYPQEGGIRAQIADDFGLNASEIKRDDIQNILKSKGYDGILLHYSKHSNNEWKTAVVFNPNQIKSATDNIGTFDKNYDDIRYSISNENDNMVDKKNEEVQQTDVKQVQKLKEISVDTNNLPVKYSNINEARKAFVEYARGKFPKSVINKNTKKEIGISRNGIDKFLSGNISIQKYATGFKIPELLESAVKVGEAENKKGKIGINGYEYYDNVININGKKFATHIRVRNTDMGDKYYGHTISQNVVDIKIEPLARADNETSSSKPVNASDSINNISYDDNIVNNMQKKQSDNVTTEKSADTSYSTTNNKPTTVHSISKKLISDYGVESKVKPSDISEAIADITSKINDTYYGEGDINRKYAKLEKAAYGVAEKIVDQMKKKDNYAEEIYNNLRKEIKSTKIRISEVDKGDFTEWNDFRKQNFGYLTISNKEGIPVDSYYKELAQEYPGMFDESTHMAVGDQLRNIVDTLRDLKPKEYDLSTEERNEMLEEVANEVILRSINLADDMGYIDKNGNADKIYTENDMRGALDKQKERLNNKHEKQLDRQKERLENKYEKRLETQKAKYIEQREKIRKQLIDKVNQQKEKAKARKKESEDRTKLLKLAREINSMKLSPQDKNKLPDILKEIDTVSKGILKKGYTTKDGKAVMGELDLKQLKEDYELLKQDENFLPDKDVELKISRLDKMQIADMNINDVRDLIQTLQEVKHEIRTKDKMINDVHNREIAHTAMESIKEIQRGKGIENKQKGKWYRGYISTQLTPERMFRRLSGYAKNGVFEGLAKDLSDGQRKSMTFKQRASEKFKTVISKTEEMSKFTGKKAELIDISKYDTQGRKVYITPDMRTSLYLHSKNYSNLKHIQYGGITIPNMDLYKQGKIKDAYESAGVIIRLTPSQVNEITSKMTPFEKQFADVAYNFFNDDCSKAINETSIALKGYEIATVRDYFPIVSNRNFINNDFESLVKNGTLEGKGMLKERKYASNPVALESVIRAINRQMSDVADYYGLAIPIRNFNKVYNSMGRNYNYSVKESLKQKWGLNADKYIENLITDLQSGRKTDGTLFDMLKGHYAQGVLSLNLGVTLKQAASYPTAAAVVGYKPLAKAFSERVSDSDRKIIDKYTPLLWYRSQGYTTSEFGDYADGTYEDWTKKGKMPLLMGWIQAMDIATTTKLWKAAEFYVRDNYKTLEQGTDEYYKQVADVYNSIIENTQPNYSTMQRPDILRNPNALVKSVTMFKTQVMQNFNILYDAYGEYNARYQDYQSNKTEENAEDLKSAAHNLGKAISSQIIAAIVLNLCDGIGRFLKGKFDDYYGEDDKDKTITLKSAMSAYLTDCFNTVMGTTLGGSETAALVEYILSIFNIGKGAVWYDIQAPALDTINNTVDSLTSLLTTVSKNGASSPWAYVKSINKLLKELGTATGIPLKNGEALLYGIYKNITDWTKKENVFETLDSWTDESKREYTKDDGHKYRANMSIKEYKEYNAYYEKIVKDMQSGKIRKKNGEKYSSNGIKQAARKKANEKFEKLFTEKVE